MEGEILVQLSNLGLAKFEEELLGESSRGDPSSLFRLLSGALPFAKAEGAIAKVGEEFGVDVRKSEEEDIDKEGT
jgi:hypothetical protein